MVEFDPVGFGNRLRSARQHADLKQIEIAKKLDIEQPSYSGYENGVTDINLKTLFKLAHILEVSVAWLLGLSDPKKEFTPDEQLQIEHYKQYIKSLRKHK